MEPESYLIELVIFLIFVFCNGDVAVQKSQIIGLSKVFCSRVVLAADQDVFFAQKSNKIMGYS